MIKFFSKLFFAITLFLIHPSIYAAIEDYTGFWVTNDGKSDVPRSVVQFFQKNNQITGKNYLIFYSSQTPPNPLCQKCRKPFQNRSLIGLPVFQATLDPQKPKQSCQIYNPDDGRHFPCYFSLVDQGRILVIRVYLGVPWIGRTLYWHRLLPDKLKSFGNRRFVKIMQINP